MTDFKLPATFLPPVKRMRTRDMELNDQTSELMEMASMLSPRDLQTLSAIVRRAAEISETEGEDVAIAVLDQIQGILEDRPADA